MWNLEKTYSFEKGLINNVATGIMKQASQKHGDSDIIPLIPQTSAPNGVCCQT